MTLTHSAPNRQHSDNGYVWRDFRPDDLDGACRLSAALGWAHRYEDWAELIEVGQGIALEHDGRLIGTGFCIHQGALATIALIIIDEAYRGRGLGRRMMQRVTALAGDLPMLLVATAAGTPLYEQFGFMATNTISQYQGVADAAGVAIDPRVHTMTPADRHAIDRLAHAGSGRGPVLDMTLATAESVKIYRDDDHMVTGFAMRRRFGRGEVIGPVVAANADQARSLVDALLVEADGGFVRMDILGEWSTADWLKERGLAGSGQIAQMSRGTMPGLPADEKHQACQFALTTHALG